jgi:signal peptidase II
MRKRLLAYFVIAGMAILVDELSKLWAIANFASGRAIEVFGGLLSVQIRVNSGGPLGVFQGHNAVFIVVTVVVILLFAYLLVDAPFSMNGSVSLAAILGAAISILIDQILHGGGVDFLHVYGLIFNLADLILLFAGAAIVFGPLFQNGRSGRGAGRIKAFK